MGHRDLTTTQIYADYSPNATESEMVAKAFGRQGPPLGGERPFLSHAFLALERNQGRAPDDPSDVRNAHGGTQKQRHISATRRVRSAADRSDKRPAGYRGARI